MTLYCDSYRDVNSVLGDRTGETFVDGWVYTGDEVMINDTGELFIVDRIKVWPSSTVYVIFNALQCPGATQGERLPG